MATNDVPVSIMSDMETEEEDLEQIKRDAAAEQQKITDEAQARVDAANSWKEQKRLDQEKKAADDKAKKLKEAEEAWKAEEVRKVEEARKAEARKMAQVVSTQKVFLGPEADLY